MPWRPGPRFRQTVTATAVLTLLLLGCAPAVDRKEKEEVEWLELTEVPIRHVRTFELPISDWRRTTVEIHAGEIVLLQEGPEAALRVSRFDFTGRRLGWFSVPLGFIGPGSPWVNQVSKDHAGDLLVAATYCTQGAVVRIHLDGGRTERVWSGEVPCDRLKAWPMDGEDEILISTSREFRVLSDREVVWKQRRGGYAIHFDGRFLVRKHGHVRFRLCRHDIANRVEEPECHPIACDRYALFPGYAVCLWWGSGGGGGTKTRGPTIGRSRMDHIRFGLLELNPRPHLMNLEFSALRQSAILLPDPGRAALLINENGVFWFRLPHRVDNRRAWAGRTPNEIVFHRGKEFAVYRVDDPRAVF